MCTFDGVSLTGGCTRTWWTIRMYFHNKHFTENAEINILTLVHMWSTDHNLNLIGAVFFKV